MILGKRSKWVIGITLLLTSVFQYHVNADQQTLGPPPGLIIAPPESTVENRFLARQLRQMLVVRLINGGMFRVIPEYSVEASLIANQFLPEDLKNLDALSTITGELGASYMLSSTLSTAPGSTWSIELRNILTDQVVWSSLFPVDTERPMSVIRSASDQLHTFGRDVRMVQLRDIETLLEAGALDRATILFERYAETRPLSPPAEVLKAEITRLQAADHYQSAQELAEVWLFDQALVELNRALTLDPENENYRAFVDEVRAMEAQAAAAQRTEVLDVVQTLIDEGYYRSADVLVSTLDQDESSRVMALTETIREAREASDDYESALAAYWSGNYDTARAQIIEAISRAPERSDYGDLLERINDADRTGKSNDLVWRGYRNQIADQSLVDRLRGPVSMRSMWEVYSGGGNYRYRDKDTLTEQSLSLVLLAGAYRRPYLLSMRWNSPAFALYWGWSASAQFESGRTEQSTVVDPDSGDRDLSQIGVTGLTPQGSGFMLARIYGFSVEATLTAGSGMILVTQLDRNPLEDTENRATELAWMPQVSLGAAVSWHWDETNRVTLRYRQDIASAPIPTWEKGSERHRRKYLTVGYGWSIR